MVAWGSVKHYTVMVASTRALRLIGAFSRPMTLLTAPEASTRFTGVLCSAPATMGQLNADLLAHEITFMVFGNTFLGGFTLIEFHKAIANLEFNIDNLSNLAKAVLQVFLPSVLRKTADINLVGLDLFFASIVICLAPIDTGIHTGPTRRIVTVRTALRILSIMVGSMFVVDRHRGGILVPGAHSLVFLRRPVGL